MISFSNEDKNFNLKNKLKVKSWIKDSIIKHNNIPGDINVVFTSDDYLYNMNLQYLNHDYYTDIITFNYNSGNVISGDLFISIDRVRENAQKFNVSFQEELLRVIIHGVLHLLGFDDKTDVERQKMREKENEMLSMFNFKDLKW